MATKYFINKLVAADEAGNSLIKLKGLKLMAVLGILWLWSFCGLASIPAARAQGDANLAIDSPDNTVNGNIVNFHTTSGLNDADWRYWWVVRGPKSQWTFAGPSGNLDLPPGDYRATVTARDRYGDTAYQDTSTFRVESPTATGTVGRQSAGNVNYRNDGRTYDGRTYNDGSYNRYDNRGNDYNDLYGDGYRDGEGNAGGGYGGGNNEYDSRYDNGRYDGEAYDRAYDNRYDNAPRSYEYDNAYNENGDGDNGDNSGYNMAGYDGGNYGDGYYQNGGEYESGPCDGGSFPGYDESGEYNYNY